MTRAVSWFASVPRATRWAITAFAAFLFYFLIMEPAIDRINRLSAEADAFAATLATFAASDGPQKRALETLALGTRQYGEVEFLGNEATRPVAFNRAVDKVLEEHKVSNTKSRAKKAPLGSGPLASKMGPDVRVERVIRDIEFDATPEKVAAVVAGLEQSPQVSTVARVQLRHIESKDGRARQVHAVVTAEAWLEAPKGRR
jgi:hypothetical protein